MFNKAIIVGNLTRDIELKYAPSGTAIGSTGIASTRKFKGGDGNTKEEVLFVDITAFGRTAEVMNQYLKKGSKLLVEGRLKLDSWTDREGGKRSKHTVVIENMTMLGSKDDAHQRPVQQQEKVKEPEIEHQDKNGRVKEDVPEIDMDDDEIPF